MPEEKNDESKQKEQGGDRDFDAMFAAYRKRSSDAVKKQLEAFKDDLTNEIKELITGTLKSTDSKQTRSDDASRGEDAKGSNDSAKSEEKHETPMDVRQRKMEAEIEAAQGKIAALTDQLTKEKETKQRDEDFRFVEKVLIDSGANPKLAPQARQIFLDEFPVIHDEERGRVHEVRGEFGPEFNSTESTVESWLDRNAHFVGAGKSGSGAAGETGSPAKQVDLSKAIADPDQYMKNREAIHAQIESQVLGGGKT